LKNELFQELESQCYPVLKLEVEIQTFAIVGGPKVDLTLLDIYHSPVIIQQSRGKVSIVISRTMIYACVVTTIKIVPLGLI
jgi:hypothetical protein